MWLRKISTTSDPEIRRNGLPIAAFLYQQLILNFTQDRLDKIRDFDPVAFEEMMRDAPEEAEDQFIRGPEEIVAASVANDVAEIIRKR